MQSVWPDQLPFASVRSGTPHAWPHHWPCSHRGKYTCPAELCWVDRQRMVNAVFGSQPVIVMLIHRHAEPCRQPEEGDASAPFEMVKVRLAGFGLVRPLPDAVAPQPASLHACASSVHVRLYAGPTSTVPPEVLRFFQPPPSTR